jgi:hypothetical protein
MPAPATDSSSSGRSRSRSRSTPAKKPAQSPGRLSEADEYRLRQGWILYEGKVISPEGFRRKSVKVSTPESIEKATGRAVEIAGMLEQQGDNWKLHATDARTGTGWTVDLDVTKLAAAPSRPGRLYQIWGIAQGSSVEALLFDIPQPSVKWSAPKLRDPKAIVGGTVQTFYVDCTVTNMGKQPLPLLVARARMFQVGSPNDATIVFNIEGLAPGQTRSVSVPFTFYNWQYAAGASVPKVEFSVIDY